MWRATELSLLYERLVEAARSIPGVQSASFAMCDIAAGCRANGDDTVIDGYGRAPDERILIQYNWVGPDYISTVGMRLLEGRDFDARDSRTGAQVAIINEAMVRRYFQGRAAIGGRLGFSKPDWEIVGIVGDARVNTPREAAVPMAYFLSRLPPPAPITLEVRTGADPRAVMPRLRAAVLDVDRNLPINDISTLSDNVNRTLSSERLIAGLTAGFGGLALGLACVGLYGVMSYAVARRKSELGLRLALGASPSRLLWNIFRESLLLVFLGLSIGTVLVYLARQFLSTLIFGIEPGDPSTILASMLILVVVAAAAACLPAWRASRVDPMVALRSE
jgi:predicted permease